MPDELGTMAPTSLQRVGVKHNQPFICLKYNALINDIGGCHNILYCGSCGNTSQIPRTTLVGPFLKVNHTSYLDKSTHKLMNGSIQQLQPIIYILLKVQNEEGGGMGVACNISPFSYRHNFNATAHLSGTSMSLPLNWLALPLNCDDIYVALVLKALVCSHFFLVCEGLRSFLASRVSILLPEELILFPFGPSWTAAEDALPQIAEVTLPIIRVISSMLGICIM